MAKKQLNYLLLVVLVSAFFSAGCAHQNSQITTAKAEQIEAPRSKLRGMFCLTAVLRSDRKEVCHFQIRSLTPQPAKHCRQAEPAGNALAFAVPSAPGIGGDSDEDFSDDELDLFEDEFEEDKVHVADPLAFWNRVMFHFNDRFYFWVLKPVARGYRAVVPRPVRIGARNFFANLTTPIRLVNCILQGKWQPANAEFTRFLLNTTVGVLGFGNPAKKYPELDPGEEDVGQTLGAYGIGNGFYIVWPFLGPSTLRDSVGLVGDFFLNPVFYVQPIEAAIGITGYEIVNDTSFKIGDYESLKKAAINPYEALRDAHIQHRKSEVKK